MEVGSYAQQFRARSSGGGGARHRRHNASQLSTNTSHTSGSRYDTSHNASTTSGSSYQNNNRNWDEHDDRDGDISAPSSSSWLSAGESLSAMTRRVASELNVSQSTEDHAVTERRDNNRRTPEPIPQQRPSTFVPHPQVRDITLEDEEDTAPVVVQLSPQKTVVETHVPPTRRTPSTNKKPPVPVVSRRGRVQQHRPSSAQQAPHTTSIYTVMDGKSPSELNAILTPHVAGLSISASPTRREASTANSCQASLVDALTQLQSSRVSFLRSVWSFLLSERAAHASCNVKDPSHPAVKGSRGVYRAIEREENMRLKLQRGGGALPSVGHILSRALLTAATARVFLRLLRKLSLDRKSKKKRAASFMHTNLQKKVFRAWRHVVRNEKDRRAELVMHCLCQWMIFAAHQGLMKSSILQFAKSLRSRASAWKQVEHTRAKKVFKMWRSKFIDKMNERRLYDGVDTFGKRHPHEDTQSKSTLLQHLSRYQPELQEQRGALANPPQWARDSILESRTAVTAALDLPGQLVQGNELVSRRQHPSVIMERSKLTITDRVEDDEGVVQSFHISDNTQGPAATSSQLLPVHEGTATNGPSTQSVADTLIYQALSGLRYSDMVAKHDSATSGTSTTTAQRHVKHHIFQRWKQRFEQRCDAYVASQHFQAAVKRRVFGVWQSRASPSIAQHREEQLAAITEEQQRGIIVTVEGHGSPSKFIKESKMSCAVTWNENNLIFAAFKRWKQAQQARIASRVYCQNTRAVVLAKWIREYERKALQKRVTRGCFAHWRHRLHKRERYRAVDAFCDRLALSKHFTAWRHTTKATNHRQRTMLDTCFTEWRITTRVAAYRWFLDRGIAHRCLMGWRLVVHMTLKKRSMLILAASIHDKATMYSVLQRWKSKFMSVKIAKALSQHSPTATAAAAIQPHPADTTIGASTIPKQSHPGDTTFNESGVAGTMLDEEPEVLRRHHHRQQLAAEAAAANTVADPPEEAAALKHEHVDTWLETQEHHRKNKRRDAAMSVAAAAVDYDKVRRRLDQGRRATGVSFGAPKHQLTSKNLSNSTPPQQASPTQPVSVAAAPSSRVDALRDINNLPVRVTPSTTRRSSKVSGKMSSSRRVIQQPPNASTGDRGKRRSSADARKSYLVL